MKSFIKQKLIEALIKNNCHPIKITQDMVNEVNQFKTDEDFLRSGGFSNATLDRAAFGFTDEDITTLMPNQLNIKWKDDLENVKHEVLIWKVKNKGLSEIDWAVKINLNEPIDVIYEKHNFYIDDGHHRYYAAKILKKPLNVNLEIKQNPIIKLSSTLSYDDFHRCVFKQIKHG